MLNGQLGAMSDSNMASLVRRHKVFPNEQKNAIIIKNGHDDSDDD